MPSEKAAFETTCPGCGETVRVTVSREDVADGKAHAQAVCQRCLGRFEAITDLDCLEWDDVCKTEVGRFG